ncbi:beta-hydroxyacyl-ACP dehydratase, partial [bacterium]|nr:beta-hydroxyacyl-ACP dehydratase [bacterium]
MPPEAIIDYTEMDFNRIVAGPEEIRKLNPQRFEMEHLDGIVHLDTENHIVVGYKDVRHDEFW